MKKFLRSQIFLLFIWRWERKNHNNASIMIREGDEAAAQEDERLGRSLSAAYKEREIQKQEEVKWAGERERKRVEE
ncbi:hypothetical protein HID58_011167 [Brassica napus]|uniref:Uncharacterized protein n=1 Tax=Brassica napus TaxID=3708 RepID=A0ABQ8DXE2_BRANA|nr:hypothetical protein HID58_011167 [Brassica napus]